MGRKTWPQRAIMIIVEFMITGNDNSVLPVAATVAQEIPIFGLVRAAHITCQNENGCGRLEKRRKGSSAKFQVEIGRILNAHTAEGAAEHFRILCEGRMALTFVRPAASTAKATCDF